MLFQMEEAGVAPAFPAFTILAPCRACGLSSASVGGTDDSPGATRNRAACVRPSARPWGSLFGTSARMLGPTEGTSTCGYLLAAHWPCRGTHVPTPLRWKALGRVAGERCHHTPLARTAEVGSSELSSASCRSAAALPKSIRGTLT